MARPPTATPSSPSTVEFHPQADALAKRYASEFKSSLIREAKAIAKRRRDAVVTTSCVDEARQIIVVDRRPIRTRQLVATVGSTMFGVFLQQLLTGLFPGIPTQLPVYAGLGFIGMFAVFWGLQR